MKGHWKSLLHRWKYVKPQHAIALVKCTMKILWKYYNNDKNFNCQCYHFSASAILKNMDKDVQPCDDFYRFACGSYLRSHVIPDDKSSDYYVFSEIQEQLSNQLRQSVEEPISSSEPKPFIVVKTLYKSCMDTCKYSIFYIFSKLI